MKLTVDANVFFAALIRDGLSRRIIFHPDLELSAPEFLLDEFEKYREELIKKSRISEANFNFSFFRILEQIELISRSATDLYVLPASKLVSDPKDWPYLACAFHVGSDILSNDPHLHAQTRVKVYSLDSLGRLLRLIS